MFKSVLAGAIYGVDGRLITVEADISNGFPGYTMVGYLSSEVKEAKERVMTAIKNTKLQIPPQKIVVSMSPADIRKQGTAFDLPIAVAVTAAMDMLPQQCLDDVMLAGELSLKGGVVAVRGILPLAVLAREKRVKKFIVPYDNLKEAEAVLGAKAVGVRSLEETLNYLNGNKSIENRKSPGLCSISDNISGNISYSVSEKEERTASGADFSDLFGQELLKRCIEIAVAGGHHLLILGAPGVGKSMAAKCIPSILPPLTEAESLEVTKIHSVAGLIAPGTGLIHTRPFRSPHHSSSAQAIIGGGRVPVPGEISLAHRGILFLDELAEFNKRTIEMLRQPLEDGAVTVSRVYGNYRFPASATLVAAMNPCPCGYFPDRTKCRCTSKQIRDYLGRVSRPLLDRFDLTAEASPVRYEDLSAQNKGMTSAEMYGHIERAIGMQYSRFKSYTMTNARMSIEDINRCCSMDRVKKSFLEAMYKKEEISTRGYYKILRTARTAADIDGSEQIEERHLYEAVCCRGAEKKYWKSI